MDLSRVSMSERLAGVGGVVLLIGLFLKWYGLSSSITVNGNTVRTGILGDFSVSGWHSLSVGRWVFLICALLAIGLAVAKANGQTLNLPITPSVLLAGLGGLSVLWIVLRILSHPADHLSVKFGIFVGLIGAALVTFGAYRSMQEGGASFGEFREHTDRFTKPSA